MKSSVEFYFLLLGLSVITGNFCNSNDLVVAVDYVSKLRLVNEWLVYQYCLGLIERFLPGRY